MLFVPAQHPLPLRLTETVGKRNCPSLELGGWKPGNCRGPHMEGLPKENLPREQESQGMERVLTTSIWAPEPDTPATGLSVSEPVLCFRLSQFELGSSHLQSES